MHEAVMEAIALIDKPLFLINTIFDDNKDRLLNIFSGDIKTSHEEGVAPGTTAISRRRWAGKPTSLW